MELTSRKRMYLVSGRVNVDLAEEIAHELGVRLGNAKIENFSNGEIHCRYTESVRGTDVFIVQGHASTDDMSVNDAIFEQLIMVDAARRASARRITVVCPFYGYGRQDRKASGREPITARLIADMFRTAGADRILSVDLHSGQIQGFFDGPVDHLTAMPVLIDYFSEFDDLVVVSPDAGRVKVAERYANQLHADLAIVHKRRSMHLKNVVEAKDIVGEVDGRTCVLIDDMIDTGGTIVAAAELLLEKGAARVFVATTHAVFSGPAVERLQSSGIEQVIVTNTLPLPADKRFDKLVVLSVAPIIARAIHAVFEDTSVSEIFDEANYA